MMIGVAVTIYTLYSRSPDETVTLGWRLGLAVKAGQVIALRGELGAGKTTLTRGIAAGLGITERITSPTFTLVNEYSNPTGVRLIHIDSYRLGNTPDEALREGATFGLEDILADSLPDDNLHTGAPMLGAVVIIEWAERVAPLLPEDHLMITLANAPGEAVRRIEFVAYGPVSAALLATLKDASSA